jgi:hypothetical protein
MKTPHRMSCRNPYIIFQPTRYVPHQTTEFHLHMTSRSKTTVTFRQIRSDPVFTRKASAGPTRAPSVNFLRPFLQKFYAEQPASTSLMCKTMHMERRTDGRMDMKPSDDHGTRPPACRHGGESKSAKR